MRLIITVGIFVLLSFVQYFPSLSIYFLSDDFIWLYQARESSAADLVTNYIDADNFFYRPTTKAYFFVMYQLFGMNPMPYHVVQIFLHGIVTALIYYLAQSVFERTRYAHSKTLFAAVAASIYLVHPINTEVVVWISAVTELIPALCLLIAMMVVSRDEHWKNTQFGLRLKVGLVALLYAIALGGHEFAIVMPVILAIWLAYLSDKRMSLTTFSQMLNKRRTLFIVLAVVAVVYLILRYIAKSHWQGGDYSYNLVNLPFNIVGNAISYVVFALVGPVFYSGYEMIRHFFRSNIVVTVGIVFVGLACAYYFRRFFIKYSLLLLTMIFLIGLAAFLPLGTIAERYVYFSGWLVYLAAVWLIYRILLGIFKKNAKREFLGVALFFICLFSALTYASLRNWHTASAEVVAIAGYFESQCDAYMDNDIIALDSPVNRIGRAWVFQVGVEEAASLVCDKNLSIIRM